MVPEVAFLAQLPSIPSTTHIRDGPLEGKVHWDISYSLAGEEIEIKVSGKDEAYSIRGSGTASLFSDSGFCYFDISKPDTWTVIRKVRTLTLKWRTSIELKGKFTITKLPKPLAQEGI